MTFGLCLMMHVAVCTILEEMPLVFTCVKPTSSRGRVFNMLLGT